jgi:hypothetical protein
VYDSLTVGDLRDTERLLKIFERASTQKRQRQLRGVTSFSELNFVAAAERALEKGNSPVALFRHIVENGHWPLISCEQEDRAHARIKEFRYPPLDVQGCEPTSHFQMIGTDIERTGNSQSLKASLQELFELLGLTDSVKSSDIPSPDLLRFDRLHHAEDDALQSQISEGIEEECYLRAC